MGRRNTRIDQEREEGGYGSRSSASGDGCAHVYGICKMPYYKKSGPLRSHLWVWHILF